MTRRLRGPGARRVVPGLAALLLVPLAATGCGATAPPPTVASSASAPAAAGAEYRIDDVAVDQKTFAEFERRLTRRKEVVVCAETTTGGYTEYEATAPDGSRYRVRHESRNGRGLNHATRLPTP